MEKLLDQSVTRQIQDVFKQLQQPVAALFFGSSTQNCEYCEQTRQMLEEVTALSSLLSLSVYDLDQDAELAQRYHVDKVPVIVLAAKNGSELVDYGVRIAGIPAGHEFSVLIHSLVMLSKRDSGLSQPTRAYLKSLQKPVHLQVFTTPT